MNKIYIEVLNDSFINKMRLKSSRLRLNTSFCLTKDKNITIEIC